MFHEMLVGQRVYTIFPNFRRLELSVYQFQGAKTCIVPHVCVIETIGLLRCDLFDKKKAALQRGKCAF